jgi:hypothetical protein
MAIDPLKNPTISFIITSNKAVADETNVAILCSENFFINFLVKNKSVFVV